MIINQLSTKIRNSRPGPCLWFELFLDGNIWISCLGSKSGFKFVRQNYANRVRNT
jgi:hypothetical protein